jgi:hypothetical protein
MRAATKSAMNLFLLVGMNGSGEPIPARHFILRRIFSKGYGRNPGSDGCRFRKEF